MFLCTNFAKLSFSLSNRTMLKSKLIKVVTLTSSISLFALFLLYRGGYCNDFIYDNSNNNFTSPNGGVSSGKSADTTKVKIGDFYIDPSLPSSKSMILFDERKFQDTAVVQDSTVLVDSIDTTTPFVIDEMMGGSKSGPVFLYPPMIKDSSDNKSKTRKRKNDK